MMVEELLGEAIRNIIANEGEERIVRHMKIDAWRAFFSSFGLVETELSMSSLYQAELVVKNFACGKGKSCTFEKNGKSLIVGWKGSPHLSLSVWKFHQDKGKGRICNMNLKKHSRKKNGREDEGRLGEERDDRHVAEETPSPLHWSDSASLHPSAFVMAPSISPPSKHGWEFAPFVASVLVKAWKESDDSYGDTEVILGGLASLNDEVEWFKREASKWGVQLSNIAPQKANENYCRFLEYLMSPEELRETCQRWGNDGFGQYCLSLKKIANRRLEKASEDARPKEVLNKAEVALIRVMEHEVEFWNMSRGGS
ncbi:hypothetical protein Patl1_24909 [Pistacia atlantica]|uniref:Uncharacterized protein n=1 Tax=Pistacia atlantica TaxID=434234 RepID=A0ACC1B3G4_9ROSI|nr:hypothetical protein Patl1_24909 [Pistacia atlantica]